MEHGAALGFPLITAAIALPFIGAIVVALIPRGRAELHRLAALLFSGGTLALAVSMLVQFETAESGFQFEVNRSWIASVGISWHVGIDGISLFLVVLTAFLFPLAIVGVTPHHDPKPYYAWLLVLEAGCIGVFCALDLFLFFVMFEIVLVPMYFLIGGWGYANRVHAALKFFLFTMLGSAFMLVGILALAFLHQDALADPDAAANVLTEAQAEIEEELTQGAITDEEASARLEAAADEADALANPPLDFDLVNIAEARSVTDESTGANPFDWTAARWIFLAFAVAFAVKVPLFPVHTWLPDAHTEAPTAGSVILAGVLLKLGTYGFLRFGLYVLPDAAAWFAPGFVTLGVVGIIYGAVVATMQRDLKRLVAYSSVAHLGFIILGTFAMTTQGIEGGILQMVNHGISTAPVMAGVFTVVMLSSIGLPGLNGFVGEFLVLIGSFLTRRWFTVVAAAGVILAALYLLWAYQRVFHGEPDDDADFAELSWREGLVMAPLIGLIVFLGVYPKPVLERMEPSVERLIEHIEDNSDFRQPETGGETAGAEEDE
jgi:NADH-quinone oxidoreductase subunit M